MDLCAAMNVVRRHYGVSEMGPDAFRAESKEGTAMAKEKKAVAPKKAKCGIKCLCGCGGTTGAGAFFLPGHDGRVKGYIAKVNAGKLEPSVLKTAMAFGAVVEKNGKYKLLSAAELRKIAA